MNTKKFNRSSALWILALNNGWDTFSYFSTLTILALYFIHVFHLSKHTAYMLYGAYATFAYALPILGGVVADKFLGNKTVIIIGFVINIIGNVLLISLHRYWFSLGLAASLVGSGLYKSNLIRQIGSLYDINDHRKEKAFTWVYLAINIGGTVGPLVYGSIAYFIAWNYIFLFSAGGIFLSAILFLSYWKHWDNNKKQEEPLSNKFPIYLTIVFTIFLISIPFYKPSTITFFIFAIVSIAIIYLVMAIKTHTGKEKTHLKVLFLLSFFGMFYFAAGLQIGTTVTLFLQQKIHEGLINIKLPASTFSTLYCFFVLILAPITTYLWKRTVITVPVKMAMGVGLAGLGIAAFAFSASTTFILTGVIIGNLLLSAGELVITPAIYTAISNKAPESMKSSMMGCWLLFIALGGYLSSLLASASHVVISAIGFSGKNYLGEFLFIAIFTLLVSSIIAFSAHKLSKMLE